MRMSAQTGGVAEGRTRLSDFTFTFHFPALEKEMATHSSVGDGQGGLACCNSWGHKEWNMTEGLN